MSDYVIETRGLTKTYGEQNSVSQSVHPCEERAYLRPVGPQRSRENHNHAGCCWALPHHLPAM